jgi:hypothetical protein
MSVNKKALWVVLVVLALLGSACTFQFTTTVNEDGTGKFVTEMGMTSDEMSQLEAFGGESFDDICTVEEFGPTDTEGVTVEQEQRGDEIWCVATIPFNDLSGLVDSYGEMDVQVNELSMTDDEFVYDVTFGFGDDPDTDLSSLAAMGVEFNLIWEVVTPGSVTEHNADEVNGDVLTWNLSPSGENHIQVRSNVGGGGISAALIIGIAVVLIVVVAAIFLLTRRKPEMPQDPQPPVA